MSAFVSYFLDALTVVGGFAVAAGVIVFVRRVWDKAGRKS